MTPLTIAHAQPEGVAISEAPGCAQLFIMSPEVFKSVDLGDRNIILFHDESRPRYEAFVSSDARTRVELYDWLKGWIAQRRHIEEVYCIGVSAGGPMAMLAGDFLAARTVWAFAPRTARRNVAKDANEELARMIQRVTGKTVRELQAGLTQGDVEKIDAHMTPDIVHEYYRNLLDADRLLDPEYLASLVDALSHGNGVTEHRVYYVPRDACDARVVEALTRCPGVTPVAIDPSDAPPPRWAFSRWVQPIQWVCRDHLVVELLRERGTFSTLFPAFRPA